ncbi:MAG: hypothetical protein J6W16_04275 [Methanobrevibacter sp.]|nr:hypothetical protein [Methanobrevibacter sp.]
MYGTFDDRIPLDALYFHWHNGDDIATTGWYEGTRCLNKWKNIGKDILDNILPNGFPENWIKEK